jgi:hypothetical protein
MGYTGQRPSAIPLDSSDIADGTITNDDLAGSITSAKITSLDSTKLTGTIHVDRLTNAPATDLSQLEMNQALLAFKIASSNQLAKFSMVDQVIDEYQDSSGVDAGNSTNEAAAGATTAKYYEGQSGSSSSTVLFAYTGADVNWTVPSTSTATIIAWGAGGGGSSAVGGAGGFISGDISVTAAETLVVKVGGGGIYTSGGNYAGVGTGAGGTGIYRSGTVLAIAGAGGGAASSHAGGAGGGTTGGNGAGTRLGSGGTQSAGGAAGSGGNAGSLNQGGHGVLGGSAISPAAPYNGGGTAGGDLTSYTSTGGGGGYYGGGSGGTGGNGSGGGGSSLTAGTNTQATGATPAQTGHANYTGSVGVGGAVNTNGNNGYMAITYSSPNSGANLTLQSVATTAESAPTSADLVVLIEDGAGTATVNTDIKGFVSRNGSAFSSEVTFVDEGDWGTNKRILVARNIDISGITTGTAMKYKLTSHNQSAGSKETRIHATSLAWA